MEFELAMHLESIVNEINKVNPYESYSLYYDCSGKRSSLTLLCILYLTERND